MSMLPYNYYLIAGGYDCDGLPADNNTIHGFYSLTAAQSAKHNAILWSDGYWYAIVDRATVDREYPTAEFKHGKITLLNY